MNLYCENANFVKPVKLRLKKVFYFSYVTMNA